MTKLRVLLLAGVASFAATGAFAADLIIDEPAAPVVSAPAGGNWDGPYIGVFGGFASGFADHTPVNGDDGNDIDLDGWLLGVDAGANFYLSDKVIGGVAADIAWSNVGGSISPADFPFPGAYDEIDHEIDWQGSLRGVLGFDGGAIMPYLTAGVAFAHANRDTFGADSSAEATHVGWTGGVGVAIAATDNMAINLEYRHSDFGSKEYDNGGPTSPEVALTQDAFTVGLHWAL
jgi:opacity protein-like surface antigen